MASCLECGKGLKDVRDWICVDCFAATNKNDTVKQYRHFKGGIYDFVGLVSFGLVHNANENQAILAKHHETLELHVVDRVGSKYYCMTIKGTFVLYRNQEGVYWLREYEDFFGEKTLPTGEVVARFVEITR